MSFYRDISQLKAVNAVLTIGMFDGVHLGHRALLGMVVRRARELCGQSVVLTFWPHPRLLFEGEASTLRFLTTIEEKVALIKALGIDHVVVHPFTTEFAAMEPSRFVHQFIVDGIKAREVIVGHDHRFGHRGEGDFALLQKLGDENGFGTHQVQALDIGDTHVSSTKIREALIAGDIDRANTFLSYEYAIKGSVVKGNQLGRTIGFPTANLEPHEKHKQIPGNGIYAVEVELAGVCHPAVANVGIRPTVIYNQRIPNIEAYILDFEDDIYGKDIIFRFKKKLRDEVKFPSIDALKAKIQEDVDNARIFFNTASS